METKIKLIIGHVSVVGFLNDTTTAQELLKMLPLEFTGTRFNHDITCASSRDIPPDIRGIRTGWDNGDIGFNKGTMAIFLEDEEKSGAYSDMMIVGHIDKESLPVLRKIDGAVKVIITQ